MQGVKGERSQDKERGTGPPLCCTLRTTVKQFSPWTVRNHRREEGHLSGSFGQ